MEEAEKGKLITMKMSSATWDKLESMCELTGTSNKTNVIASSIKLMTELTQHLRDGDKIYIKKPNGDKLRIRINGM